MSSATLAAQRVIASMPSGATVDTADFDGDGDGDIVAGSVLGPPDPLPRIVWYENDGATTPGFTAHSVSPDPFPVTRLHTADLDGDGDTDIATIRSPAVGVTELSWFENIGGSPPAFTSRLLSTESNATGLGVDLSSADMDEDGDLDLLYLSSGGVVWLENTGGSPPSFTRRSIASLDRPTYGTVEAADVDGDGHFDVVNAWTFYHAFDPFPAIRAHFVWYESDGATPPVFSAHEIDFSASARLVAARAADIDGDGDTDLAAAWSDTSTVAWYENDGATPPAFAVHVITEDPDGIGPRQGFVDIPNHLAAGDLELDGDVDLVSASVGDFTIAAFLNRGGAPVAFRRHTLTNRVDYPAEVALEDLDGDGDRDVIFVSGFDGVVAWYETR